MITLQSKNAFSKMVLVSYSVTILADLVILLSLKVIEICMCRFFLRIDFLVISIKCHLKRYHSCISVFKIALGVGKPSSCFDIGREAYLEFEGHLHSMDVGLNDIYWCVLRAILWQESPLDHQRLSLIKVLDELPVGNG